MCRSPSWRPLHGIPVSISGIPSALSPVLSAEDPKGSAVRKTGGTSRIIVDPVAREVTHLVVDQKHRNGAGRLVPVDLVDATTGQIRLRCTLAEFQALRPAQETERVPHLDPSGPQESHSPPGVSFLSLSPGVFGVPGAAEIRSDRDPGRP